MATMYSKKTLEGFRVESERKKELFNAEVSRVEALGDNATAQEIAFASSLKVLLNPDLKRNLVL